MQEVHGTTQRCQAGSKNHGRTTLASGIGIVRPSSHIPAPLHYPKISLSKSVPEIDVPEKFPCVDVPEIIYFNDYPHEIKFSKIPDVLDFPEISPCVDVPEKFRCLGIIDYDETFYAEDARTPPKDVTDWDEEDEEDYEGGIEI